MSARSLPRNTAWTFDWFAPIVYYILVIKYSHHAHQVAPIEKWKLIRSRMTIFYVLCKHQKNSMVWQHSFTSHHNFPFYLFLNCFQINVYLKQRNFCLLSLTRAVASTTYEIIFSRIWHNHITREWRRRGSARSLKEMKLNISR